MVGSRNDRNPRNQLHRLAPLPVLRGIIPLRVETAQRGNRRADHIHGRGVFGHGPQQINDPLGQFAFRHQDGPEFIQLALVGQVIVVQQMNHFFVTDLAGQFIDIVAAINQLAALAAHIAQPRLRRDDSLQALADRFRRDSHESHFLSLQTGLTYTIR